MGYSLFLPLLALFRGDSHPSYVSLFLLPLREEYGYSITVLSGFYDTRADLSIAPREKTNP